LEEKLYQNGFRLGMQAEIPSPLRKQEARFLTANRQVALQNVESQSHNLNFTVRVLISFLISTIFIFPQFGLNFGSYSLNFSLVAMYALLAVCALYGIFRPTLSRLIFYGLMLFCGLASLCINGWGPSPSSFFLLVVVYFPLLFSANLETAALWGPFAARKFCDYAALIAAIACIQFFAQFVIRSDWLFGFHTLIPDPIKASGTFNTVIELSGDLKKSNGFFLREPSILSLLSSIALLLEYFHFHRKLRILLLLGAMAVSLSGTGIIVLLFGLFFPLSPKALLRIMIIGAAFGFGYLLLSEALELSIFTNRLAEFQTPGTSGYQRFVAPYILMTNEFDRPEWAPFFGHGPGSITMAAATLLWALGGSHDPTWAKSIFEYGIYGAFFILGFVICTFWGNWTRIEFRIALIYAWLASGGQLLAPDFIAIMFILISPWPTSDFIRSIPGVVAQESAWE
jgi:hypothetical protein